jgi:LysM repeat protein
MQEIDAQRFVLPGLLVILILGAFLIIVTNGGGEEPARALDGIPTRTSTTKAKPASSKEPVAAPTPSGRFVKVKAGDTPTSIADRSGISTEKLLDLNPSIDPDNLQPGQNLKLVP